MSLTAFTRWMYRGNRPNWLARFMNALSAAVASAGLTSHYMETLEVTGRKSGRTISLPVVIAIFKGERYLVSMLGEDVNWVRNVRAAGGRAAFRRWSRATPRDAGRREEIQLEEVPAAQRAPILKAYLQRAPACPERSEGARVPTSPSARMPRSTNSKNSPPPFLSSASFPSSTNPLAREPVPGSP